MSARDEPIAKLAEEHYLDIFFMAVGHEQRIERLAAFGHAVAALQAEQDAQALTQAVDNERERVYRTLASAVRKVLSPELVALVEAEIRRGIATQHSVCGNWTPQKAVEAAHSPLVQKEI